MAAPSRLGEETQGIRLKMHSNAARKHFRPYSARTPANHEYHRRIHGDFLDIGSQGALMKVRIQASEHSK